MTPRTTKDLCQRYNIKPSRSRGQCFLINKGVLDKIIQTADLKTTDTVLEIGPGLGILTRELAKRVKKVIAVELDKKLAKVLKETLQEFNNVEIIQKDILKHSPPLSLRGGPRVIPAKAGIHLSLRGSASDRSNLKRGRDRHVPLRGTRDDMLGNYKIIANLPYQITSPVLWKFLHEEENKPELMVVMVQKEVAERICAKPPNMNLLAVLVQYYGQPKIVARVKKGSFWPMPRVDSAILRIAARNDAEQQRRMTRTEEEKLFKLVKAGFAHKRKLLASNLSQSLKIPKQEIISHLQKLNLSPTVRAQELGVGEWVKFMEKLDNLNHSDILKSKSFK